MLLDIELRQLSSQTFALTLTLPWGRTVGASATEVSTLHTPQRKRLHHWCPNCKPNAHPRVLESSFTNHSFFQSQLWEGVYPPTRIVIPYSYGRVCIPNSYSYVRVSIPNLNSYVRGIPRGSICFLQCNFAVYIKKGVTSGRFRMF